MARWAIPVLLAVLIIGGCASMGGTAAATPRWQHIVVVVEENHNARNILGNPAAPYLNQLARDGTDLTNMRAETHPSEPNYLALFSGSTQSVTNDSCPHQFSADNLGHQLIANGYSFAAYSDHLPKVGYTGCNAYPYTRRCEPWLDFSDLSASVDQPLDAMPSDYDKLPTVSFVIPDLQHNMHDGSIGAADAWLRDHLSRYAGWARSHDSMLIVTWDENDGAKGNHIATFATGEHIKAGTWPSAADHYSLLRTVENVYHLAPLGAAATATPIAPLA